MSSQQWKTRPIGVDKVVINELSHHGEGPSGDEKNSIEFALQRDPLGESQPTRNTFKQIYGDKKLTTDMGPILMSKIEDNSIKGMSEAALQISSAKHISSRVENFDINKIKRIHGASPDKGSMSGWKHQFNANETIESMMNADL